MKKSLLVLFILAHEFATQRVSQPHIGKCEHRDRQNHTHDKVNMEGCLSALGSEQVSAPVYADPGYGYVHHLPEYDYIPDYFLFRVQQGFQLLEALLKVPVLTLDHQVLHVPLGRDQEKSILVEEVLQQL